MAPDQSPLQQIWYLSETLDLDLAVRQLNTAACGYPEVILGSSEKFLPLSKILAWLGNVLKWPPPYFHQVWWLNKGLVRLGLRSQFHFGTRRTSYALPCGNRGTGGLSSSRWLGAKGEIVD